MTFYSQEVIIALNEGVISKHAHIKVRTHVNRR